jgi:hypothetical protein
MSNLSQTIVEASLDQIAPLFLEGAKGDMPAARAAAQALLDDYHPQTNQQLTLAADIIHYRRLAQDNLKRSAEPDLPLTKILRLRGSAVSLSREANKAQRQLDKLQAKQPQPEAQPATDQAPPTPAELAALHAAREIIKTHKKPSSGPSHPHQLSKQAMLQTMKQNAARNAAQAATAAA